MLQLEDIIRSRVAIQFLQPRVIINEGLRDSFWIAGKYGLKTRVKIRTQYPLKQLKNALKLKIKQTNRIVSRELYLSIMKLNKFDKEMVYDDEIVSYLLQTDQSSKQDLCREFDISPQKLRTRIQRDIKFGNIIEEGDILFHFDNYIDSFPFAITSSFYPSESSFQVISQQELQRVLIIYALSCYPYLKLDQLEFLTQMNRFDLITHLSTLNKNGLIKRGITTMQSPDELFTINEPSIEEISWETITPFMLEKRDAFVELLTMEHDIIHGRGDYWFFIHGLPAAEFNLVRKKGTKQFIMEEIRLFSHSRYELSYVIEQIQYWASIDKISIQITDIKDINTRAAAIFANLLIKRGYLLDQEALLLQPQINYDKPKEHKKQGKLTWENIGQWYREKQYLSHFPDNLIKLLDDLIQLDDIESISSRMQIPPQKVDFSEIILTHGIHHRKGYVSIFIISKILGIWHKEGKLSILDKKILRQLEKEKYSKDNLIELLNINQREINQRLNYLETLHKITKDLTDGKLIIFPSILRQSLSLKSNLAVLITKFLNSNIPLSLKQLSRFFGFTPDEIYSSIQPNIRNGTLIEGYFLDDLADLQITLPGILDEIASYIPTDSDPQSYERIDILPLTDPMSILHLHPLLMNYPKLQPKNRVDPNALWYSIFWDGMPAGYLIKIPRSMGIIDYDIEIYLRDEMDSNPVLSGIIQKLVNISREWYNDELSIKSINGINPKHQRYASLHFLIESLGINLSG